MLCNGSGRRVGKSESAAFPHLQSSRRGKDCYRLKMAELRADNGATGVMV